MCQAVADDLGVRVLFLKGPIASLQGLREKGRVSGDVDVLCRPRDQDAFVAALAARGWRARPLSTAAREFVTHSVTVLHDEWPCDIDVHVRFPGFFADPDTVFEALWRDRECHQVAAVDLDAPSRLAQWLVLLLHGLRSPDLPRNAAEVDAAHRSFRDELTDSERSTLLALVDETGATEVTADFFRGLGVPRPARATPSPDLALWRLQAAPSRTESWMLLLMEAHGWSRLHILARALVPAREELVADHPEATDGGGALLRAYARRLRRAAALAPRALLNVARSYRDVRAGHRETGQPAGTPPEPTAATGAEEPIAQATGATDARDTSSGASAEPRTHPRFAVDRAPADPTEQETTATTDVYVLPLAPGGVQVPLALQGTAAALWTIIEDVGMDIDAVTDVAEQWWDVPRATLRHDVAAFLDTINGAGRTSRL
nr:PqqD family peptide modification chaperone [Flexivirga aerilata]